MALQQVFAIDTAFDLVNKMKVRRQQAGTGRYMIA